MSALPSGVWILALTSLLNDGASEMIAPLMPIFLIQVLGGTPAMVGLVEGAADAAAAILKLLSGRWSDRLGRTRPFIVGGYALSNLARPAIALAWAPALVLIARVVDRIGKGLRTSPRDALLAALVPPSERVRAYAVTRAGDHSGSILGALAAWALLSSGLDLRTTMLWSLVPGFAVVLLVAWGVREPAERVRVANTPLLPPPPGLVRLLLPFGVIALGRISDTALLLRASESDVGLGRVPLLWILLHLVKVAFSLASPLVAGTLGPLGTVATGWVVFAAVQFGMGFATDAWTISALFVVYGAYHGLTESSERALIAARAPESDRATAFGWYHIVTGLLALPAGALIGGLWATMGPATAFGLSAALALLAALLLLVPARRVEVR